MRLIDLDELKAWREHYIRSGKAKSYDDMTALEVFINSVDEVSYVECVNCKSCKYKNGYMYCTFRKTLITESDGCTWGEQR